MGPLLGGADVGATPPDAVLLLEEGEWLFALEMRGGGWCDQLAVVTNR